MSLDIESLRLLYQEMNVAKAERETVTRLAADTAIADAQLAKALLGVREWLGEKMPMEIVIDIVYELDDALEQANIERPT